LAKSAIEKFISSYISSPKKKSKKGYEEWLRKNGVDPTSELSEKIGEAYAEKEKKSSHFSLLNERLSESGLLQSGYAKYLGDSLESEKDGKINLAMQGYLDTDSKNKAAYLKEENSLAEAAKKAMEKAAKEAEKKEKEILKNEEAFRKQLLKDAEAGIKSMSTIDYNEAYKYALEVGLDEENAQKIAKSITDSRRTSAIEKITTAIFSRNLTTKKTKEYALRLGLPEDDANVLADLAFKMNESAEDIVSEKDFLDYLLEQINKNK